MEIDPTQSEAQLRQKSESLRALTTGSIPSSISKLSGSSRVLPSEKDFHFYYNFDEFKAPIDEIGAKSQAMLRQIGSAKHLWGGKNMDFPQDVDDDDAFDWLVNVNDEVIERFDLSIDEFSRLRKAEEEEAKVGAMVDENGGFQVVYGKKKKGQGTVEMREKEENVASPMVRVVERDKKTAGPKPKVPFHIPTIKRPQEEFNILVNNSNQPFQHVWLERSEDGSRFIHPLEKLCVLDFVDQNIEGLEPVKPPPLEVTPFKLVEEVNDLKALAAKLRCVNELAVDLEHNQYRSFQGLTCLMQISTRTEDFVIDTLKLRVHIGPYLREIFKDPTKKKVMHGAERDIIWLQRDFGIYVCNLFDTGQASRVLQLERNSLEYLLHHFCQVTANKQYQNADWRLRPLPGEMLRYAREDTHYLFYIYDLMRIRLVSESTDPENRGALLEEVYKRSYDVCIQLYEKELLTDTSYLYIYGVQRADLNAAQLSVLAGLYEWRDSVARSEDESTGYILPNKILLEIAKQMPLTTSQLRRFVRSKNPYVERNISSVVNIIRHCVQNASSFEAVAKRLKEARIQMAAEINAAGADISEVQSAGDNSSQQAHIPASLQSKGGTSKLSGYDSKLGKDVGGASFKGIGQKRNVRKDINGSNYFEFRGERVAVHSHRNELNRSSIHSEKVAEATVQVLKSPIRAFGALLGSSASKKKTDLKKDKEEDKLEQIRSSVNFPFYSFSYKEHPPKQSPKAASEEPERTNDALLARDCPMAPSSSTISEDIILLEGNQQCDQASEEPNGTSSNIPTSFNKSNDIILLDSDSDDEAPDESLAGNEDLMNWKAHQATPQPELVVLDDDDDDDDDEPMSLSDLSSSFQQCLESINQNQKTKQDNQCGETGPEQFEPFDYEASREEVKTGEDDGGKNSGKKKGVVASGSRQEEGGVPQGRRRQAFPASGNCSETFR